MAWPVGITILLTLIFLGVPIGYAMTGIGLFGVWSIIGLSPTLSMLGQVFFDTGRNYTLSVVPLFLMMGNFVVQSGAADELYDAANAWLRHRRGGLAMATIVACGGFSSVCGSSLATAATMARIAMPSMRRYGYSDRLASASIAAGGTLGILIPPSVILVIYGILTEQNIGKLFLAGIIPGLIGILFYIIAVRLSMRIHREKHLRTVPALPLRERLRALKGILGVLALFVVVLGGIYGGIFTATEAAGMGASGAVILTLLKRKMDFKRTVATLFETAKMTAMLFFILFGAVLFLNYVNLSGMTKDIQSWLSLFGGSRYVTILVILLIYLILGCVLESLSMILLTVPIFFPVVSALGFDLIWFGIFVVVATEISFITPPIGLNVFTLRSILKDVPIATMFRGVVPFVAIDFLRLLLLVAFPWLALILPNTIRG